MYPSHKKILIILKHEPASLKKLQRETHLSPDGIRGRLSEIRTQFGYDIQKINGKYQLTVTKKKANADVLLHAAEEHHLFGQKTTMDQLMNMTHLSSEELTEALTELYHCGQVFQYSKDTVMLFAL